MSQGRDLILSISDDGTSTGTPIPIEHQGDLVINTGKSAATAVYKNGQNSSQNDGGQSVNVNVGLKAPTPPGQSLLLDLNDSGDDSYFWVTNRKSGGVEYEFASIVAIPSLNSPTNNDNTFAVQFGIQGGLTRGSAA